MILSIVFSFATFLVNVIENQWRSRQQNARRVNEQNMYLETRLAIGCTGGYIIFHESSIHESRGSDLCAKYFRWRREKEEEVSPFCLDARSSHVNLAFLVRLCTGKGTRVQPRIHGKNINPSDDRIDSKFPTR